MPKLRDRINSSESIIRDAGVAPRYFGLYIVTGALLALLGYFVALLPAVIEHNIATFLQPSSPSPTSSLYQMLPWLIVLAVALVILYACLQAASVRYLLTDTRLFVHGGLISHHEVTIPLERIQDMHLHQSLMGRIFDWGDVLSESAGTKGQILVQKTADPQGWLVDIDAAARARLAAHSPVQHAATGGTPSFPSADLILP